MENYLHLKEWGPRGWIFIHAISFSYPETPTLEHRRAMYDFIRSLPTLLPCAKCRRHFLEFVDELGVSGESHVVFSSRYAISKFMVEAHNRVNLRNGKPAISYNDVVKFYVQEGSSCPIARKDTPAVKGKSYVKFVLVYIVLVAVTLVINRTVRYRHRKFAADG